MRCPKCGFISFDHLTSCAKCGKDIADIASELQGTSINVDAPMFLSGALAAYADRQDSFADQGLGFDVEGDIDFSMEDNTAVEEVVEAAEDIDLSFDESPEEVGISMSMEDTGEITPVEEEAVDFTIEPEAEAEAAVEVKVETEPERDEESLEELDLMSSDDLDEGGLEFDLEDFIKDMDDEEDAKSLEEEKSQDYSSDDIDIDLDEEES